MILSNLTDSASLEFFAQSANPHHTYTYEPVRLDNFVQQIKRSAVSFPSNILTSIKSASKYSNFLSRYNCFQKACALPLAIYTLGQTRDP